MYTFSGWVCVRSRCVVPARLGVPRVSRFRRSPPPSCPAARCRVGAAAPEILPPPPPLLLRDPPSVPTRAQVKSSQVKSSQVKSMCISLSLYIYIYVNI